jgi:hypothetical protein
MPSTFSSRLRIELPGLGELTNTWGTTLNNDLGTLIEEAIAGIASITHDDSASYTMSASNGSSDQSRCAVLSVTGTLTANRNIVCPTSSKLYLIYNNTTGGFTLTIKTAAGAGIAVTAGTKRFVYCDGTNVVDAITSLPSGTTIGGATVATLTGSETLTNKTITSPTITVRDNVFTMQDNGDPTKQMQLEISALSAGVTAAVSMPAVTAGAATLVTANATQTLTNKSLTTPTITGTPTASGATWPDLGAVTTVDINGGSVDGATIGAAARSTIRGTTIDASTSMTVGSQTFTAVSTPGLQTMYIPASAMTARTDTVGGGPASATVTSATNKVLQKSLDFDPSVNEFAQFQVRMPKSWNAGTVTASFIWTANSASTNSVVWGIQALALGDDETIDTAFGTAITLTDANTATAYQVHISADTAAVTIGSTPASRNLIVFQVYRDAVAGGDTLAADASLLGVNIFYTTNAADDT